jgi:uncharacterized membrane protein
MSPVRVRFPALRCERSTLPKVYMNEEKPKNNKAKWGSIALMLMAAIPLSFNLTFIPFSLAFLLFFLGHSSMAYLMYLQKEYSLVFVNIVWCTIDIVGMIRWL